MSKFKVGDRVICGDAVKGVVRAFIPEAVSYLVEVPELHEWGIYTEEALILRMDKAQPKRKYHNIIFVTHDEDKFTPKRKFIFKINRQWRIKSGDKLYADTRYGKKVVTAVCEPFEVNEHGLNQLSRVLGGHGTLKSITGRAVSGYVEEPF